MIKKRTDDLRQCQEMKGIAKATQVCWGSVALGKTQFVIAFVLFCFPKGHNEKHGKFK